MYLHLSLCDMHEPLECKAQAGAPFAQIQDGS